MPTKLFLRNTTNASPNVDTSVIGTNVVYDMIATAGSASDTDVVDTAASGTEILWTQTSGGNTVSWVSGRVPSGGFTLTSTDISIWAHESNMNANAGGRYRVFKYTPGSPATLTELGGGPFNDGIEFGTAATEMTWVGNVTDTAFAENDRIVVKLYITNVGTMAGGHTCTLTFNAADASTGDSFFNIAETVTFKSETVNQSLTGALSFTGTTPRQTSTTRAGALSFVGDTPKRTNKSTSSSLSFSASMSAIRLFFKTLTAMLTFQEHAVHTSSWAGWTLQTGSSVVTDNDAEFGFAMEVTDQSTDANPTYGPTLTIGISGTQNYRVRHNAKRVSGSGNVWVGFQRSNDGTNWGGWNATGITDSTYTTRESLTSSESNYTYFRMALKCDTGTVGRVAWEMLTARDPFALRTQRALSGALSFVGTLARLPNKALAGAVSFSSTSQVFISKTLVSALTFTGTLFRAMTAFVVGAFQNNAFQILELGQQFQQALSGALTFVGARAVFIGKGASGSLTFTGNNALFMARSLSGALTFTGTLPKRTARALSGALTFAGALASSIVFTKALAASLSFSGAVSKRADKVIAGLVAFNGAAQRAISRAHSAVISFSGNLGKTRDLILGSILSFAGGVTRSTSRAQTATLSFVGTVGKMMPRTFTATITFAGNMSKHTSRTLAAALSFVGVLTRIVDIFIQQQLGLRIWTLMVRPRQAGAKVGTRVSRIAIKVVGPQEMAFKRGTNIEFEAVFTNADGALYDPDANTVKLQVKKPDGTVYTGWAFSDNKLLTKLSTGIYRTDFQSAVTDPTGTWTFECQGTLGTKVSIDDVKIQVKA